MTTTGKAWFYVTAGKRYGPLTEEQLIEALCKIGNSRAVPIWREGFPQWIASGRVEEIAKRLPPAIPSVVAASLDHSLPPQTGARYPTLKPEEQPMSGAPQRAMRPSLPFPDAPVGVGGWLLFLCICLVILNPLGGLMSVGAEASLISQAPLHSIKGWLLTNVVVELVFVIWSVAAGIVLLRRMPQGVAWTKTYFWSYVVWAFLAGFSGALAGLPAEGVGGLIGVGIGLVIPAAIWTTYLSKSKRVANTYGMATSPSQAA